MVIVLSRVTVGAHTSNSHILGFTNASSGGFREELIDSRTGNSLTSLLVGVVSFTRKTLRADSLNNVVSSSTVTFSGVEVVELVRSTSDPADSVVNIISLTFRTLSTVIVDQIESRLANTSTQDEVLIFRTNRSTNALASLTTSLLVSFDTVTASDSMVKDLSSWVALTADIVDQVESRKAPASSNNGVPNFIVGARSVTDSIGSIIDFSRRTNAATVAYQVVSFLANTVSIDIIFIRVAGRSTKSKILDVSRVAVALLCDFTVG